jgi:cytochrome c peroxidase
VTPRRFFFVVAMYMTACAAMAGRAQVAAPYVWKLPKNFPTPRVPADDPMSEAKVELGRHLFYDTRLSSNGTQSCSSCHKQELAFTEGKGRAVGSTGQVHPRGSMSLVNVAYAAVLTWGNPSMTQLEQQALVPMFGDQPIELGLEQPGTAMLQRLRSEPRYQPLFEQAFGAGQDLYTVEHVTKALASFERSIISASSPYDRYHNERDDSAISPAARRGETLYFSQPLSCFRCHGGFTFSGAVDFAGHRETEVEFHNTGLYNIAGPLSYPSPNTGIYEVTRRPEDVGKFKAPTLRNIAVTAPYMHDGSAATLEDVLAHYAAGGRTIADGPNRGNGHDNPGKSPTVRGFPLAADQRDDLIAFLRALTDDELLHDPRLSNPWKAGSSAHH